MSNALELKQTKCNYFCEFNNIVSYCFDCPALLCSSCKDSIHKMGNSMNHDIIEIKNNNVHWSDQELVFNILEDFELAKKVFTEISRDLNENATPFLPIPETHFPKAAESFGKWTCEYCTFDNPLVAVRCDECKQFPTGKTTGIDYKLKLETFSLDMWPKFRELDVENVKNVEMSIEHIINCYTNAKSKDTSILNWSRDSYPNLKSFSIVNKILEVEGFGIRRNDLDRQYSNNVKQENQRLLSYLTKQDIREKLLNNPDLLDPSDINVLNKIEGDLISKQITEEELWEVIIKSDVYTQKDIRMLITELDLVSQEQICTLRAFINDSELGDYLKTSVPGGKVKLFHVKQAVSEHIEITSATNFLKKTCELCCDDYPMPDICGFITCQHELCKNCASNWLKEIIATNYPCQWNCPFCTAELFLQIDKNLYYSQLRTMLSEDKVLLDVFEAKLLTEQLMKSKHFHWCANEQCTNGFEAEGVAKIQCPHCKVFMCVKCNRLWHEKHEDKTCQEFELWMLKHDALSDLLKNIGIECPKCGMRYALAPGGCLHFDCKGCGIKFCGGCYQLFVDKCDKPKCVMSSFHSHHPRNCLYFLRDYAPVELENMLKEFEYPKLEGKPEKQCQFMITHEKSMKDVACNKDVYNTTGMCDIHYKEYLVQFINRYKIDPADFKDSHDLNLMLFQMVLNQLTIAKNETEDQFKERLKKQVKDTCMFYIPKGLIEEEDD